MRLWASGSLVLFSFACGSSDQALEGGGGASGFDSTKGWRLVQTITNDDADVSGENQLKQQNYAKIGYCGLDVTGEMELVVRNQKLYSVSYQRLVEHEEMYIATPE